MAVALVLYMAAGHFFLKPLFARPRPCDINTSITMLVARPHGHSFPPGTPPPGWQLPTRFGCKTESWARPRWCWQPLSPLPGCTSMCTSPPMSSAAQCWASLWALRPPHLQTIWRITRRNNRSYKKRSLHKCVQRPFCSIIPTGAALSGSVPGPSTPAPADCPQAGRRPALPPASSAERRSGILCAGQFGAQHRALPAVFRIQAQCARLAVQNGGDVLLQLRVALGGGGVLSVPLFKNTENSPHSSISRSSVPEGLCTTSARSCSSI